MTKLAWDNLGARYYESGVDHGVLYFPDSTGKYTNGVSWNGITSIVESSSGGDFTPYYADDRHYLNIPSVEEFGATLDAFTYPNEFSLYDGCASVIPGVTVGQQPRIPFGLSYRSRISNDLDPNLGFKLNLVYDCLASPSDRNFNTIDDSIKPGSFSWKLVTMPIDFPGYAPLSKLTVDSRMFGAEYIQNLLDILWGSDNSNPRLPYPAEVVYALTHTRRVADGGPVGSTYIIDDGGPYNSTYPIKDGGRS